MKGKILAKIHTLYYKGKKISVLTNLTDSRMKVDIFDFDLDKSLIAKQPASPRDSSRLLDLSDENEIVDRHFYDLPAVLRPDDVLVFNDTKVIPARLYGKRGEAAVESGRYCQFL